MRKRRLRPIKGCPPKKMTIQGRWYLGLKLEKLYQACNHDKDLLLKKARNLCGLESIEDIDLHRKFPKRWPLKRAFEADAVNMPWRCVIPLLTYEPSFDELGEAKGNKSILNAHRTRREQAELFMNAYGPDRLLGRDFIDAVSDWRKQHSTLWSKGKVSRMKYDRHTAVKATTGDLVNRIDEYIATVNDNMTPEERSIYINTMFTAHYKLKQALRVYGKEIHNDSGL